MTTSQTSNNFKTPWRRSLASETKIMQKCIRNHKGLKDIHYRYIAFIAKTSSPLPSLLLFTHLSKTQRVLSILFLTTYTLLLLGSFIHLFALGISSIGDTSDRCADRRKTFVEGVAYGVA